MLKNTDLKKIYPSYHIRPQPKNPVLSRNQTESILSASSSEIKPVPAGWSLLLEEAKSKGGRGGPASRILLEVASPQSSQAGSSTNDVLPWNSQGVFGHPRPRRLEAKAHCFSRKKEVKGFFKEQRSLPPGQPLAIPASGLEH